MAGAGSEGRGMHELGRRLEERAAVRAAGCEGVLGAAGGWVLRGGGCSTCSAAAVRSTSSLSACSRAACSCGEALSASMPSSSANCARLGTVS